MNTMGKSPIWVLHLLSVQYLFYVNTVIVYKLKYDTFQWACNIQRLPGSDVGMGQTCLPLTCAWWRDGESSDVAGLWRGTRIAAGAACWKDVLWGARARESLGFP